MVCASITGPKAAPIPCLSAWDLLFIGIVGEKEELVPREKSKSKSQFWLKQSKAEWYIPFRLDHPGRPIVSSRERRAKLEAAKAAIREHDLREASVVFELRTMTLET